MNNNPLGKDEGSGIEVNRGEVQVEYGTPLSVHQDGGSVVPDVDVPRSGISRNVTGIAHHVTALQRVLVL